MEKGNVELLAPAGNYEGFLGAIHAGADAVYLGGNKFGARAYADNFSSEEVCRAIHYAHWFGRKVYLTVNTLMKDSESDELVSYLTPFYEAGLDGVIVQDLGTLMQIKEAFPALKLHASTQMTVTGSSGASFLKELGVVRVVPARELSLAEMISMKEKSGLEIEAFIHGAMCYSYSGQCLFSSLLGGRSGNRGRCAQPCRLPYRIRETKWENRECYPLSLKDMCTISCLPDLIEAGIDSFKIEGRMKKPEYTAGVTAVYRKYIDLYRKQGRAGYRVEPEDMELLRSLYIRTDIQDGYYFKHNGADMVTLTSPAYKKSSEELLAKIRKSHFEEPLKVPVFMEASFAIGQPARLTAFCRTGKPEQKTEVTVCGAVCGAAQTKPVTEENIRMGLKKLGNSCFALSEEPNISVEDGLFLPLKAINELRRAAVEALEEKLYAPERLFLSKESDKNGMEERQAGNTGNRSGQERFLKKRVLISTQEQFAGLLCSGYPVELLYLESDMVQEGLSAIREKLVRAGINCRIFLALPYIVREKDLAEFKERYELLMEADGCLVRNLESFYWLRQNGYPKPLYTDAGMYCFNQRSAHFWLERAEGICLPYELNRGEFTRLTASVKQANTEQVIYGRIPLMITANCIQKTAGQCRHRNSSMVLMDRFQKAFPAVSHCRYCYNVLYNSVPLSLHKKAGKQEQAAAERLVFTVEGKDETAEVLRYFDALSKQKEERKPPYADYTTGHEKRGVL